MLLPNTAGMCQVLEIESLTQQLLHWQRQMLVVIVCCIIIIYVCFISFICPYIFIFSLCVILSECVSVYCPHVPVGLLSAEVFLDAIRSVMIFHSMFWHTYLILLFSPALFYIYSLTSVFTHHSSWWYYNQIESRKFVFITPLAEHFSQNLTPFLI